MAVTEGGERISVEAMAVDSANDAVQRHSPRNRAHEISEREEEFAYWADFQIKSLVLGGCSQFGRESDGTLKLLRCVAGQIGIRNAVAGFAEARRAKFKVRAVWIRDSLCSSAFC
jgi:hypothetical protein